MDTHAVDLPQRGEPVLKERGAGRGVARGQERGEVVGVRLVGAAGVELIGQRRKVPAPLEELGGRVGVRRLEGRELAQKVAGGGLKTVKGGGVEAIDGRKPAQALLALGPRPGRAHVGERDPGDNPHGRDLVGEDRQVEHPHAGRAHDHDGRHRHDEDEARDKPALVQEVPETADPAGWTLGSPVRAQAPRREA